MKAGATRAGRIQGKASIMANRTHIRLAAAVAALLSATPALADRKIALAILTADQFRAVAFDNPVQMFRAANPEFFRGTVLEGSV